jgi:hypothetical protein
VTTVFSTLVSTLVASVVVPDFSGLLYFVVACAVAVVVGVVGLVAFVASLIVKDDRARASYLTWAKRCGFAVALFLCALALLART